MRWRREKVAIVAGAGVARRYPSTRASLTLCRDIFVQVLRIAEREESVAVPLLRRTVADLDQQLQRLDGPGSPQWDAECQEFGCHDNDQRDA